MRLPSHTSDMLLGLRGMAALWVYLGHLFFSPPYDLGFASSRGLGPLSPVILFHFLAVDLFLILSGFLLYLSHHHAFTSATESRSIDRFYLSRLARIYPLYLFSVLLIGVYHLLGVPHPMYSGMQDEIFRHWEITLALNLLLMDAWGIIPGASWNEPAWTLSILFFLYLIFPNLVLLLRFAPRRPLPTLLLIYALIVLYHMLREIIPGLSHSDGVGGLMRGIFFFVIGCLFARMYEAKPASPLPWNRLLPATFALFPAIMLVWQPLGLPMTVYHILYPPLFLGLLYAGGRLSRKIFANRPVLWLGTISYSLYLMHYPLMLLLKYVLGDVFAALSWGSFMGDLWLYLLVSAIVLYGCWLCHALIERPLLRVSRGRH